MDQIPPNSYTRDMLHTDTLVQNHPVPPVNTLISTTCHSACMTAPSAGPFPSPSYRQEQQIAENFPLRSWKTLVVGLQSGVHHQTLGHCALISSLVGPL